MKKVSLLFMLLMLAIGFAFSQHRPEHPGGKPDPKEHFEHVKKDVISPLNLSKEKEAKVIEIFKSSMEEMDKKHEAGKRPEKEEMDKLLAKRDAELKKVLSESEFKKLKELEEKSRPKEPMHKP